MDEKGRKEGQMRVKGEGSARGKGRRINGGLYRTELQCCTGD